MSAFAAKIARLASAEGEEDVDILRHHRVNVLLAEAAAILREGSSARHRAQAVEKIMSALSGHVILECDEVSNEFIRAVYSSSRSFAADAADVGDTAATFAKHLDVVVLIRFSEDRDGRKQRAEQIMALLEEIRAGPEAVDESLRRLGTTLTAARLELFSFECLVETTHPGDPVFAQRAAFARRMVELDPSSSSYFKLGDAEFDAGNPRAAYAAALRGVTAARRERSFHLLFIASKMAIKCFQHGALGLTWRWSQLAPFLDTIEEALPHLKRWMPPAMLEQLVESNVVPMRQMRRLYAHSDRELLALPLSGPEPNLELRQRTCAACGKQQLQMLKCSRCKAAFYCDAACQKRHWREHKAACGAAAAGGGGQAGA